MSTRGTHEELTESAAAYALGALDGEERAAFEDHLSRCETCRAEVDSYGALAATLAYAAPAVDFPQHAAIRQRLLGRARASRPEAKPPAGRRADAAGRWRPRVVHVASLAAAASLAVAVATGVAYQRQRHEMDLLRLRLTSALGASAARDSTFAAFLGPEVHVVSLSMPERRPSARVFWNHTRNVFIVTAFDLPPTPDGKTYQLWAISKGKAPASMGTFEPGTGGRTMAVLPVPAAIASAGFIDDCALTLEPDGGSPQPTESPRLLGSWRHTD